MSPISCCGVRRRKNGDKRSELPVEANVDGDSQESMSRRQSLIYVKAEVDVIQQAELLQLGCVL